MEAARYWEQFYRRQDPSRGRRSASWLDAYLSRLPRGARVLDVGCGTGNDLRRLAARGAQPYGVDFAAGALRVARARVPSGRFTRLDLAREQLPFPDASFDVVVSKCALQCFRMRRIAFVFAELARVVRPRGTLLFVVPSTEHLRRRLEYHYEGARRLEPRTLHMRNGIVVHFFNRADIQRVLRGRFRIERMREGLFAQPDWPAKRAWVVRARRRADSPGAKGK